MDMSIVKHEDDSLPATVKNYWLTDKINLAIEKQSVSLYKSFVKKPTLTSLCDEWGVNIQAKYCPTCHQPKNGKQPKGNKKKK